MTSSLFLRIQHSLPTLSPCLRDPKDNYIAHGSLFPIQSLCIVECLLHTQQCTICLLPVQEPRSLVTTLFEVSCFLIRRCGVPAPQLSPVEVSFMLKANTQHFMTETKLVNWNRVSDPILPQGWVPSLWHLDLLIQSYFLLQTQPNALPSVITSLSHLLLTPSLFLPRLSIVLLLAHSCLKNRSISQLLPNLYEAVKATAYPW